MNKGRLEAFSDGVLAVIITIMVLEMKSPNGTSLAALRPVIPVLLTYVLSFVYIGIYWNNHHHLLHATQRVNGATLWANLHLLFWLSLVPFATAWMGGIVSIRGRSLCTGSCCCWRLLHISSSQGLSLAFMERAQRSQRLSDVIGRAKSQSQFMRQQFRSHLRNHGLPALATSSLRSCG